MRTAGSPFSVDLLAPPLSASNCVRVNEYNTSGDERIRLVSERERDAPANNGGGTNERKMKEPRRIEARGLADQDSNRGASDPFFWSCIMMQ